MKGSLILLMIQVMLGRSDFMLLIKFLKTLSIQAVGLQIWYGKRP